MYQDGANITDIRKRLGVPCSTMFRWLVELGINRPLSKTKALQCAKKPGGFIHRGLHSVFSGRVSKYIPVDSSYELARLMQLEADDSVVSVDRCADAIPYEWRGKTCHFNPDFVVTYSCGRKEIEEVKPERFLSDRKTKCKIQAGESHYLALGIPFVVRVESDIGEVFLTAALSEIKNDLSPEQVAERRERRLRQKRKAQRALIKRMRDRNDPLELAAYRADMAERARAFRLKKKVVGAESGRDGTIIA